MATAESTKIALVTGANKGIGFETARQLGQQGVSVLIGARDEARGRRAAEILTGEGASARWISLDVSDPDSIASAAAEVERSFGRLDILVNNAALVRRTPAVETSIEVWREVMEVNLNAAFVCSCEAAGPMTSNGGGAIINIASIMGLSGGGIYPIASYHASKGGLVNLTRGLAVEWAPRGIRVNAIAPTWVRTELTETLLDDPEMSRKILELMPLHRFAETTEVAAGVVYLASPAAKIVTGHVLAIDGGYLAR